MAPAKPVSFAQVPEELIQAVIADAARDAECVGRFLNSFKEESDVAWPATKLLTLPADFLLGLGAALRLFLWEQRGIQVHREANLPTANEALREAFVALTYPEAEARVAQLRDAVAALSMDHFAWSAQAELEADVTLGAADEELVLDTLADFLWEHRPRGCAGSNS